MNLTKDDLLKAYHVMRTIREFEERVHVEFAAGEIPGFVHLYAGEEACAAGVCLHLSDDDYVASTHRGHGHCIAKGVDVHSMMAELFGRSTGLCHGKGGSMHVADLSLGMLGANGIVGGEPALNQYCNSWGRNSVVKKVSNGSGFSIIPPAIISAICSCIRFLVIRPRRSPFSLRPSTSL